CMGVPRSGGECGGVVRHGGVVEGGRGGGREQIYCVRSSRRLQARIWPGEVFALTHAGVIVPATNFDGGVSVRRALRGLTWLLRSLRPKSATPPVLRPRDRGGMGIIYRATNIVLGREVAVKVSTWPTRRRSRISHSP